MTEADRMLEWHAWLTGEGGFVWSGARGRYEHRALDLSVTRDAVRDAVMKGQEKELRRAVMEAVQRARKRAGDTFGETDFIGAPPDA